MALAQHLIRNEPDGVVYSNIRCLRDQAQFLDVNLLCEDGEKLPAHKIILAAHSEKFKRILGQMTSDLLTPVTHSIFLSGVKKKELSLILDFIYEGEVSLSQADLGNFLSMAEKLHINSLVDKQSSPLPTPFHEEKASHKKLASMQENNRCEDVIKEEVYLDSENQTAVVEGILENKPEEEEVYLASENEHSVVDEIFENTQDDQTVETGKFEESQHPDRNKILTKQKKETRKKDTTNEATIDANKVLIENLKILGMSKLKNDILKNTRSRKFFKAIMSKPTKKLPCPVQLMNSNQLYEWLTPEIRKDIIEQGFAPKTKIPWGDPEFLPKCWPNKLWPWHLVSNPNQNQKHHRPKNVGFVDTLKAAVSNRLKNLNIDPEMYISEDYTEEEDIKKRRARGLKAVNS